VSKFILDPFLTARNTLIDCLGPKNYDEMYVICSNLEGIEYSVRLVNKMKKIEKYLAIRFRRLFPRFQWKDFSLGFIYEICKKKRNSRQID